MRNFSRHCLAVAGLMVSLIAPAIAADAAKAPAPDASAQAAAMKLVTDVYKNELAQATKPEEKAALAKKILQTGIETKDDPAGKFALLIEAKNLAVEAMDPTTALAALDETAKYFQIDTLPAKVETLTKLAKAAHLPAEYKALVAAITPLIDAAMAADDYDAATQFTNLALGSARRSEDTALANQLSARLLEIAADKAAYAKAEQALAALAANPTDPDANLTVGKYLCFFKGDWDRGLPMLALGSDATLKALALTERTNPTIAEEQVALGDGWWALAVKEKGALKNQLFSRATKWYRQALPQLEGGFAKAKVENRLADIENAAHPPAAEDRTFLSDLPETNFSVGYGELGKNGTWIAGRIEKNAPIPIAVQGKRFPKGLLTHPPSNGAAFVVYSINRRYKRLRGSTSINDGVGYRPPTPIVFEILGDGAVLWKSKPISFGDSTMFDLDVQAVDKLEIRVECPGSNAFAWAAWLDPYLTKITEGSPAGPGARAGTVDLMKLIDPANDAVEGTWKIETDGLTCEEG